MTNDPATPRVDHKACLRHATLEQRVACIADSGPEAIEARLRELDREWTAGRVTKAVCGLVIVAGLALTAVVHPWWLVLPAAGGLFLVQYLFTRRSWLGRVFQEAGYRSGFEVDQEKMALKVIRGDFRHLPTLLDIENKDDISRLEGEGGIVMEPDEAKVDPVQAAKVALEAAKS
ncbi:hypothetical protein [Gemmata sp.]|uniref:hypothetical protein n=1 Tax=Gemmata sp. TaxID=1914242 RepID=UPI003F6E47B0